MNLLGFTVPSPVTSAFMYKICKVEAKKQFKHRYNILLSIILSKMPCQLTFINFIPISVHVSVTFSYLSTSSWSCKSWVLASSLAFFSSISCLVTEESRLSSTLDGSPRVCAYNIVTLTVTKTYVLGWN